MTELIESSADSLTFLKRLTRFRASPWRLCEKIADTSARKVLTRKISRGEIFSLRYAVSGIFHGSANAECYVNFAESDRGCFKRVTLEIAMFAVLRDARSFNISYARV